mmetsp:Transcript_24520/g.49150  ORF Transcript_24520/g.49150 Transcript_24520/m.49150 type:complete len:126 (-) Transcript_24520:86-463(-)
MPMLHMPFPSPSRSQSNVEDVAVQARTLAEQCGMHAVNVHMGKGTTANTAVSKTTPLASQGESPGSRRRARLEAECGVPLPRARGEGWATWSPLGPGLRSETEAAMDFNDRQVFRVLLRPNRAKY